MHRDSSLEGAQLKYGLKSERPPEEKIRAAHMLAATAAESPEFTRHAITEWAKLHNKITVFGKKLKIGILKKLSLFNYHITREQICRHHFTR
ncbi:MAG: hypothetical protein ACLR23_26285 [Clostridia bacterium]